MNRTSGQAPILYWIDAQRLGVATLQDISTPPTPPPAATGSPGASPAGSAKPTAKPKPTRRPPRSGRRRGRRRRRPPAARHRAWDNPAMVGRMVEMGVESVRVHMLSTQHVVILKDVERDASSRSGSGRGRRTRSR